jgi:hypothetical protein
MGQIISLCEARQRYKKRRPLTAHRPLNRTMSEVFIFPGGIDEIRALKPKICNTQPRTADSKSAVQDI